ncbi:MAG: hypothetical protein AAFZ15_24805 [Bacteroidota bacterium]
MKSRSDIKRSIKSLIAQNELVEAMETLLCVCAETNPKYFDIVVLLSRDMHGLKEMEINGTTKWEVLERQKRKVAQRMLKLINQIGNTQATLENKRH